MGNILGIIKCNIQILYISGKLQILYKSLLDFLNY